MATLADLISNNTESLKDEGKCPTLTKKDLLEIYHEILHKRRKCKQDDGKVLHDFTDNSVYDDLAEMIRWNEGNIADHTVKDQLFKLHRWKQDLLSRLSGVSLVSKFKSGTETISYTAKSLYLLMLIFPRTRMKMAIYFLKKLDSPIGGALIGSALLKSFSSLARNREEFKLEMISIEFAGKLEDWAVRAINESYDQDNIQAISLIMRGLDEWNGANLLSIADSIVSYKFMATNPCQARLTQIWNGYFCLSRSPSWVVNLSLLFPPIVLTQQREPQIDKWEPTAIDVCGQELKDRKHPRIAPLLFFFNTPKVKFYYHAFSYGVYLLMFTFFVNTNLAPVSDHQSIHVTEYLVWIWGLSMLLDEIRQLIGRDAQYSKGRYCLYWRDGWNYLDLTSLIMLAVSVALRLTLAEGEFIWARRMYAGTLSVAFLRFIHIFYVFKSLGPLIIIIRDMSFDILRFLVILILFILPYAVSVRSLRFPNVSPSWHLIVDILYQPYWTMFGEFFGDDGKVIPPVDIENCTHDEVIHRSDPENSPRCEEDDWLAVIFLAFYMMTINILLLNLLIALLMKSYERVMADSFTFWYFYRYRLVFEFYEKPVLAPPFTPITYVGRFVQYIRSLTDGTIRTPFYSPSPDSEKKKDEYAKKERTYFRNVEEN